MNRALKVVVGIIVAVIIVWLLFEHIFPWVDENFFADPTLETAPATGATPAAAPPAT